MRNWDRAILRREITACAVRMIRAAYPAPDDRYMGFNANLNVDLDDRYMGFKANLNVGLG